MSISTQEEAIRCNVVVERLIKQYSVEEIAEIEKQLRAFLGLFSTTAS